MVDEANITPYKNLPKRDPFAERGSQGTFVYAPDIAVFIDTDDYGIIDLGPSITNFSLMRNVNAMSTFQCSFDNKWRKYDRTIRRMNRVAVFLKRVEWVQVFAGYITQAPWETVTPGDAQLMAECTLKRLYHTYWDPQTAEAATLFPMFNIATVSFKEEDGGAAVSLYRLLTEIAKWKDDQIFIQKLPAGWLNQAYKLVKSSKHVLNPDDPTEIQKINEALKLLFDNRGWNGQTDTDGDGGSTPPGYESEQSYRDAQTAGDLPDGDLTPLVLNTRRPKYGSVEITSDLVELNQQIYLRADAAISFEALLENLPEEKLNNLDIQFTNEHYWVRAGHAGYIAKDDSDKQLVKDKKIATENEYPSGAWKVSTYGWGTQFFANPDSSLGQWIKSLSSEKLKEYGWKATANPYGIEFVGNKEFLLFDGVTSASSQGGGPLDQSASNAMFFWPGIDVASYAYTGSRAWINDVPLIQSVQQMAGAALRDFQSGPDGSFIAFYPDRVGTNSSLPAMVVHNIEIRDFKSIISDQNLVTHYASIGDYFPGQEAQTGTQDLINTLVLGGVVSIDQEELMAWLMGLEPEDTKGMADYMLQRFGIRPVRFQNYAIRSTAWNYAMALHKFQELWANQWQVLVTFTFLPEIYPGMRIEMIDNEPPISVYVEQVTHTGSRTGGFLSQVTISTPTRKKGDKWVMLRNEWRKSGDADIGDTVPKPDVPDDFWSRHGGY